MDYSESSILVVSERLTNAVEASASIFNFDGIPITQLQKALPGNFVRYKQFLSEAKRLEELLENHKAKIESQVYRRHKEGSNRALQAIDLKMYVSGDKEVVACAELVIEIRHIKNQLQSIVEALEMWSWRLKDITSLRIAELQDAII